MAIPYKSGSGSSARFFTPSPFPLSPMFLHSNDILKRAPLPTESGLPANTFILEDDKTSLIRYTLPFLKVSNDTCRGGTCTELLSTTGLLEFNFTGTDVWLFGKPGGLARITLDGELIQILDTNGMADDGAALFAVNDLSNSRHTMRIAGVAGAGLNLLIDFFGVAGTVEPVSTDPFGEPPSESQKKKLTGVIIGSVVGFLGLMIIGGLLCFFMLRRKRRRQQNYNGGAWKESSFKSRDAAFKNAPSGGFQLPSFGFLKNSQDRPDIKVIRPSIDKEREPYGTGYSQPYPPFGSTFNSMPMNTMDSNTSPPGTSVPLFAQPIGIQQPPVAIQPSAQIHPYNQPSLQNPAPFSRKPWAPPSTRVLTQMTRRQPDEADELETTPLMEAPPADIPPGYTSRSWHEQNDLVQSLGVRLESGGRYSASPPYERTFESDQANYANQQQGQGFMRNPQTVSTTVTSSYSTAAPITSQSEKAAFHKPSVSTFTTATTDTRSDAWTRPSLTTPSLDSRSTSSDAPLIKARPVIPPTPSAPIPSNFPSTATTGVITQQSMKRMKGPRTRGESIYADSQRRMPAVPMTAIPLDDEDEAVDPFRSVSPENGYLSDKRMGQTQLDAWNKLGGVKVPMNRVRGYGEDPESPVDPGVNMGRARQI